MPRRASMPPILSGGGAANSSRWLAGSPRVKAVAAIKTALDGGRWKGDGDLVAILRSVVPPESAVRLHEAQIRIDRESFRRRHGVERKQQLDFENLPIDYRITRAYSYLLTYASKTLVQRKHAVREYVNGEKGVRLIVSVPAATRSRKEDKQEEDTAPQPVVGAGQRGVNKTLRTVRDAVYEAMQQARVMSFDRLADTVVAGSLSRYEWIQHRQSRGLLVLIEADIRAEIRRLTRHTSTDLVKMGILRRTADDNFEFVRPRLDANGRSAAVRRGWTTRKRKQDG